MMRFKLEDDCFHVKVTPIAAYDGIYVKFALADFAHLHIPDFFLDTAYGHFSAHLWSIGIRI